MQIVGSPLADLPHRSRGSLIFVGSTIRAFEYFGAVPAIVVPDQLRSAVSGPDRYEPDFNPTHLEMAQHSGVTVIPARPRRPRDKAKVEAGVLITQRWILSALRHRQDARKTLGDIRGDEKEEDDDNEDDD